MLLHLGGAHHQGSTPSGGSWYPPVTMAGSSHVLATVTQHPAEAPAVAPPLVTVPAARSRSSPVSRGPCPQPQWPAPAVRQSVHLQALHAGQRQAAVQVAGQLPVSQSMQTMQPPAALSGSGSGWAKLAVFGQGQGLQGSQHAPMLLAQAPLQQAVVCHQQLKQEQQQRCGWLRWLGFLDGWWAGE